MCARYNLRLRVEKYVKSEEKWKCHSRIKNHSSDTFVIYFNAEAFERSNFKGVSFHFLKSK